MYGRAALQANGGAAKRAEPEEEELNEDEEIYEEEEILEEEILEDELVEEEMYEDDDIDDDSGGNGNSHGDTNIDTYADGSVDGMIDTDEDINDDDIDDRETMDNETMRTDIGMDETMRTDVAHDETMRTDVDAYESIRSHTAHIVDDSDDAAPPENGMGLSNMAAMIADAANKRTDRIEETGVQHMSEQPEAKPQPEAERPVPLLSIADEAAGLGRFLVKGREKVVEAVAVEKSHLKSKDDDTWGGPADLRKHYFRSAHNTIVKQAASLGVTKRLKAVETTNYVEEPKKVKSAFREKDGIDHSNHFDKKGRRIARQQFLIDEFLQKKSKEQDKDKEWELEQALEFLNYKTAKDVKLPTQKLPQFELKPTSNHGAPSSSTNVAGNQLGSLAATMARERTLRLGKHNAELRVLQKCPCRWCENPNPFQTMAYKEEREERKQNPDKARVAELAIQKEEEHRRKQKQNNDNPFGRKIYANTSTPNQWKPPSRTTPPADLKPTPNRWKPPSPTKQPADSEPPSSPKKIYKYQMKKPTPAPAVHDKENVQTQPKPAVKAPPVVSKPAPAPAPVPAPEKTPAESPAPAPASAPVPAPDTMPAESPKQTPASTPDATPLSQAELRERRRRKKEEKRKRESNAQDEGCACVVM